MDLYDKKMYDKGYRYKIVWSSTSAFNNPIYVKDSNQAARVIREDYPKEKGWKAVRLEV